LQISRPVPSKLSLVAECEIFLRMERRGMWVGWDLDVKALRCEKQGTRKQARTKNRQQQQR
jgi:hypothetical protein